MESILPLNYYLKSTNLLGTTSLRMMTSYSTIVVGRLPRCNKRTPSIEQVSGTSSNNTKMRTPTIINS